MLDETDDKPRRRYRGESPTERQTARWERLVTAGLKTFGGMGYKAATVRQVCAEAGLTERYFYESFTSKDDLFLAVYARCVDRVGVALIAALEAADDTAEAKARALLEAYFGELQKDPLFARVLLIEVLSLGPELEHVYREAMGLFTDHLQAEASVLLPRESVAEGRAEIAAAGIVGAIVHVAMRWVISNFERPREEVLRGLLDLLIAASR